MNDPITVYRCNYFDGVKTRKQISLDKIVKMKLANLDKKRK